MNEPNKEAEKGNAAVAGALQKNIESVMALEKKSLQQLSAIEHVANKVTTYAGSTICIIVHLIWFGGWFAINSGAVSGLRPFDPLPFQLLDAGCFAGSHFSYPVGVDEPEPDDEGGRQAGTT